MSATDESQRSYAAVTRSSTSVLNNAKNTATRVLRDDLSLIKVDTVSRNEIPNEINEVRVEVAETLGREDTLS
ncbi:Developmental regulator flbA [Fusarium oxysporum f. sp. albedinis]|nr:Developmental regulator flbA [Fusarium oxysporum f. sp. albedinis]